MSDSSNLSSEGFHITPEIQWQKPLQGQVVVVSGIRTKSNFAADIAAQAKMAGCEALVLTCAGERELRSAQGVADSLGADMLTVLDARDRDQMKQCFASILERFGRIDSFVHSIAFFSAQGDDAKERMALGSIALSPEELAVGFDVTAHSYLAMSRLLVDIMQRNPKGGSILGLHFHDRIIGYLPSQAKACLESYNRWLAAWAGEKKIRFNLISAGPTMTPAGRSAGVSNIIEVYQKAAPLGEPDKEESFKVVANAAVYLMSPLSSMTTGHVLYTDNGFYEANDYMRGRMDFDYPQVPAVPEFEEALKKFKA